MKLFISAAIAFGALSLFPALAVEAHHQTAAASAADGQQLASGEVRKVDKEAGKVTIRHGPIANLDMPPMTMVFRVMDPAMLEQLKPGDKIRFAADKVNGNYTVMRFEVAK
jgi:Cu/Ag efflux protein CusF